MFPNITALLASVGCHVPPRDFDASIPSKADKPVRILAPNGLGNLRVRRWLTTVLKKQMKIDYVIQYMDDHADGDSDPLVYTLPKVWMTSTFRSRGYSNTYTFGPEEVVAVLCGDE